MPLPPIAPAGERSCAPKGAQAAAISLPVLAAGHAGGGAGHGQKVRRSKNGPRRAIVLALVHVVIVGHVLLWWLTGMRETLSPVEPSEAMYTLEKGLVNAGFIFFALAILSTLVFGRFFCGWGCHVVALQDACGWAMKKIGVRPRPFRTRLLIIAPLVLALYMFVWPTFKREVVAPVGRWVDTSAQTGAWAGTLAPVVGWETLRPYLGEPPPRPEFRNAIMKRDFWETFPPWYIAIPFLGICGFACVYFLGAKGFCTYGCPYGGFFGPADLVAPGRILVTDACEHCGHCTSVCTSNVRVHEEVRDFGMVVDPGCMKCLDCVSVCPNDALYFGFARPAVLARPRTEEAKGRKKFKDRVYDLTIRQEILFGLLFLVLTIAFRNMFNMVPLLMAIGMSSIATFLAWKLWQMVGEPNVRLQSLQLKLKGRLRPWGVVMGGLAVFSLAAGAWGNTVKFHHWRASVLDAKIVAPFESVFSREYTPDPVLKVKAERALGHFQKLATPADGGFGWGLTEEVARRMAWLSAVSGDKTAAEKYLREGIRLGTSAPRGPASDLLRGLAVVLELRGAGPQDAVDTFLAIADSSRQDAAARLIAARILAGMGYADRALEEARKVARAPQRDAWPLTDAADVLAGLGAGEEAIAASARAVETEPRLASAWYHRARLLGAGARGAEALQAIQRATELAPDQHAGWAQRAVFEFQNGRPDDAERSMLRALELSPGNEEYASVLGQIRSAKSENATAPVPGETPRRGGANNNSSAAGSGR